MRAPYLNKIHSIIVHFTAVILMSIYTSCIVVIYYLILSRYSSGIALNEIG